MILTYASIQESQHQRLLQQDLRFLDVATRQRLARFRRWQDAQASLLGRLLLRDNLRKYFNYELQANSIAYSPFHKPYLCDSTIQFNISHSGKRVVCAVQEHTAIGVDIEQYRPISIGDFKSQMTVNEWTYIQTAKDSLLAFYDYWTSKEAILKVVGTGLQIDLMSFEIPIDRAGVYLYDQYWYLRKVELEVDYCCYVSSALPIQRLIVDKVSDIGLI